MSKDKTEDIVIGSGKVTKIELAKPTEEKSYYDNYTGEYKTKNVVSKKATPKIQSTITLDKKLSLDKSGLQFTFDKVIQFGQEYELILRKKETKPEATEGRVFRDE